MIYLNKLRRPSIVSASAVLCAALVFSVSSANAEGKALSEGELTQLFEAFDGDRDERITRTEFGTVVSSVRVEMSPSDVEEMFADYDADGDGNLRFTEFAAFMGGFQRTDDAVARQMEHAFLQFDANRDGGLDASEIMALMEAGGRPMDLRSAKSIVFEADLDGNGRIDAAEFAGLSG